MNRRFLLPLVQIAHYIVIPGLAWKWVLGIDYPFWKLVVIALINCAALLWAQFFFRTKTDEKKGAE